MTASSEALGILRKAGLQADHRIDVGETALAFAALTQPGRSIAPYRAHLDALVEQFRSAGPVARLDDRLTLFHRVLVAQNRYNGGDIDLDDPDSANVMQVIDRRRGLPVALGIIYLHVANALGWPMEGLHVPGHFLLSLAAEDGRAVLDPFRAGQICRAGDVSTLLPVHGADADEILLDDDEDDDDDLKDFGAAISRRDVVLRLQHNLKFRQIERDDLDGAASTLQAMILFAPDRSVLWRELGCLQAERGHMRAAIDALDMAGRMGGPPLIMAGHAMPLIDHVKRQVN